MIKKAMTTALILSLGISMPGLIFAHEEMTQAQREQRLDKMAKELSLSQDQKNQVRGIKEDMHRKMEDAEKDGHEKIRALLNNDQQAKFDKMMAEKHN